MKRIILKRPIWRKTSSMVHYRGQFRQVLVGLLPPNRLAFKLSGCRKVYDITADAGYWMALKGQVALDLKRKIEERKRRKKHGKAKKAKRQKRCA